MEHLSFELICRIADRRAELHEEVRAQVHLEQCTRCRREVEIQQSILKASRLTVNTRLSGDFTRKTLAAIMPQKGKKWYEKLLQNMGNIIALALVLGFLGYISSITSGDKTQIFFPTGDDLLAKSLKALSDISHQFLAYYQSNVAAKSASSGVTNTFVFGLLAIFILAVIDRVVQRYFRHLKA